MAKRRNSSTARLVAAETAQQGAEVRAQAAEEALASLRRVGAIDALLQPKEAADWLDDLSRVMTRAAAARSPDLPDLECLVCLDAPRNVARVDQRREKRVLAKGVSTREERARGDI